MQQIPFRRISVVQPVLLSSFLVLVLILTVWLLFSLQPSVQAAPRQQTGPEVQFAAGATQSVTEENTTITLAVEISAAPTSTLTVDYVVIPGTATSGSDYTGSTSGTLTFPIGDTGDQDISVTIREDTVSETNETFSVVLQDVENGRLGARRTATITILDDDPTPTATGGSVVFADGFEPNDDFNQAGDIIVGGGEVCNLTLWPIGDVDFFRFAGKVNANYTVETDNVDPGIDTVLSVYDVNLNLIGTNDDSEPPDNASRVSFTAKADGFYYAQVTNRSPTDPTNKKYCIEVIELVPEPTATPLEAFPDEADDCEFNSTVQTACLIVEGVEKENRNFVPTLGSAQDTDVYKLFVKPGLFYTCETFIPEGSPADTNLILRDGNGNDFVPNIGNDDKAPGDFGSRVTYLSTYTGWLHLFVGPRIVPPFDEAHLHVYSVLCTQEAATPTSTPAPFIPPPGGGTGSVPTAFPTATPFELPSPVPTPTPIDVNSLIPPTATPPTIDIQPLPTATAVAGAGGQTISINVTLYYDANQNNMVESTEGINNAVVALYDNLTGSLLAFGTTNELGRVPFNNIMPSGAVQVVIPFLNYSQLVAAANDDIVIRVVSQPLPGGIP